jgi:site-specific DNA-methyltransferase (adenine-specific)
MVDKCPPIPKDGIVQGDAVRLLQCLRTNSVDAIVSDPPYGEGVGTPRERAQMNTSWDKFKNPTQFQSWTTQWGSEALRVLKPGGSIFSFGGARQYPRMAVGLEDAGFHTKDMLEWLYYTGMPKNRRQLKPAHEPIYWGIKEPQSEMILNLDAARIPFIGDDKPKGNPRSFKTNFWQQGHDKNDKFPDYKPSDAGRFPTNAIVAQACDPAEKGCRFLHIGDPAEVTNVLEVPKPGGKERAESHHPTQKPTALMGWIDRLVVKPGGTIVDPFVGGGSTCVAAHDAGIKCIGFELDKKMARDAQRRLDKHPIARIKG